MYRLSNRQPVLAACIHDVLNMFSAKCKIEWNGNFEVTYLKNCVKRNLAILNTHLKRIHTFEEKRVIVPA